MILVQITICDDEGTVVEQTVRKSESVYAWEVKQLFDQLGDHFSRKIDPDYDG